MSDKLPRFERACAELMQAMGNFMAALSAEMARIESCVPPHSHPPAASAAAAVPDRQASSVCDVPVTPNSPGGDLTGVSSQTAPAEAASPPPAAFSESLRCTPERIELLRETYTSGVPVDEILVRLNALPAKVQVAKNQIGPMANHRGWKRPPEKPPVPDAKIVKVWTPRRLKYAQAAYEGGTPMPEIVTALNSLPGPVVNSSRVSVIAAARHWKRGAIVKPAGQMEPVPANATQIIHWARERGIIVQGRAIPVDEINARRRHLGLAPFVLRPSIRGAVR